MSDHDLSRVQNDLFQLKQEIQNLSRTGLVPQSNPPLERAAFNLSMSLRDASQQLKVAFLWGCAILAFGTAGILACLLMVLLLK